jgi:hypothetical protein
MVAVYHLYDVILVSWLADPKDENKGQVLVKNDRACQEAHS